MFILPNLLLQQYFLIPSTVFFIISFAFLSFSLNCYYFCFRSGALFATVCFGNWTRRFRGSLFLSVGRGGVHGFVKLAFRPYNTSYVSNPPSPLHPPSLAALFFSPSLHLSEQNTTLADFLVKMTFCEEAIQVCLFSDVHAVPVLPELFKNSRLFPIISLKQPQRSTLCLLFSPLSGAPPPSTLPTNPIIK